MRLSQFDPLTAPRQAVEIARKLLYALALAHMGLAPAEPVLNGVSQVWGIQYETIDQAGNAIDAWLRRAERANGGAEPNIDPTPNVEARRIEADLYARLGVKGRA